MFVSFFPDTNKGPVKVGVVVGGQLRPYPNAEFQKQIKSVLGIRLDRHDRLWVLDHAQHGLLPFHRPRIFAFDIKTGRKVFEHVFALEHAPLKSMLNDVQIAPDGRTLYISDSSYVGDRAGLLVVDISGENPRVRRVLDKHPSVQAGRYDVIVNGRRVTLAGAFCMAGGIDGIALDEAGETLYYAALNSGTVYRVRTSVLRNFASTGAAVSGAVEKFADATMTDGMVTDGAGNVYLTDMEHDQVVRITPNKEIEVVARDPRLRWPDGFAWASDGSLYVSASALHVNLPSLIKTKESIARGAPYHILRIRDVKARPGVVGQ
jgi:sugar lactone lactonase YvrE